MKGYTKGKGKGKKFIPTTRKKSALSKSDIANIERIHNDPKNIADIKKWQKKKG